MDNATLEYLKTVESRLGNDDAKISELLEKVSNLLAWIEYPKANNFFESTAANGSGRSASLGAYESSVGIWDRNRNRWLIRDDGTDAYLDGYKLTPTVLSKTYTTNSYVTQTSFNRIEARQVGRLVIVNGNLGIDNAFGRGITQNVGKISFPSNAIQPAYQQVPCSISGDVYISVGTDGTISIYNYKTTNAQGWCRFNCVLIL